MTEVPIAKTLEEIVDTLDLLTITEKSGTCDEDSVDRREYEVRHDGKKLILVLPPPRIQIRNHTKSSNKLGVPINENDKVIFPTQTGKPNN